MPEEAKTAAGGGGQRDFVALNWKPFEKATLLGWFSLALPSRTPTHECALHAPEGRSIDTLGRSWVTKGGGTGYATGELESRSSFWLACHIVAVIGCGIGAVSANGKEVSA